MLSKMTPPTPNQLKSTIVTARWAANVALHALINQTWKHVSKQERHNKHDGLSVERDGSSPSTVDQACTNDKWFQCGPEPRLSPSMAHVSRTWNLSESYRGGISALALTQQTSIHIDIDRSHKGGHSSSQSKTWTIQIKAFSDSKCDMSSSSCLQSE